MEPGVWADAQTFIVSYTLAGDVERRRAAALSGPTPTISKTWGW
ncbi:hypothetical protein ABZ192_16960 [Streptomyces sp. NPDC006235]